MSESDDKRTMSPKRYAERMRTARVCPDMAHLPSFGLMAPNNWDYHSPGLKRRALAILASEGIDGATIDQTAPALFWYRDAAGELQLHEWTDDQGDK